VIEPRAQSLANRFQLGEIDDPSFRRQLVGAQRQRDDE